MPLDPFFETMLKQLAAAEAPEMVDSTPAVAREMYRAMGSALPAPELHDVSDASAGDVPIRIYRPGPGTGPCVVYFHGGGWVIGDLDTHDGVCRQLATATGYTVIAVDYRLAPEHPYPAPLDDCYNALTWIIANAESLRIDAGKVAVAGDSAGGNLSASVCLRARDNDGPAIAFQALLYPVTDTALDTVSYSDNADGYMLTREGMEWFFNHYIGHDDNLGIDPLVAPTKAGDLSGLPPACVITAEFDPLRDEGEAYAEKLAMAGVRVSCQRFDGMIHGFFGMTDNVEGAREALALVAGEIRAALD